MRTSEKITEIIVLHDNGTEWILSYHLQTQATPEGWVYGLRVEKKTPSGTLLEEEETYGITGSRIEALAMVKAFAAGTVTPCVLLEMTDEWFSENQEKLPVRTYHRAG